MATPHGQAFRVGVTRDFLDEHDRNVWGDIGLERLTEAGIEWEYLPQVVDVLRPHHIKSYDALIMAAPSVDGATFDNAQDGPVLLARFGVGYDAIDVDACTRNDVLLTITPDGARLAVATATLTMVLSVLHNVVVKDRIARSGDWSPRVSFMGRGLTGKTVGLLGVGNAGAEFLRLIEPFHCRIVGHDPFCSPERAESLGVELMDLPTVAQECDVLVVLAALTEQTRHLVDAGILSRMKPGAVLVNMARGPIVDEAALVAALEEGRLCGAGLDVFEQEPPPVDSPLLTREDVVLAPHCLAWTDEMSRGNGNSCVQAVLDVAAGRVPTFVVNRDVLERPRVQQRLSRNQMEVKR